MSRMLLEVKDLFAGYGGTEVLHGLSMKIEEGSITTLLGANGAGKTTTMFSTGAFSTGRIMMR